MLSYKRLHIFTTPLLARSSLLHVSWVLRYHSPGGNVGSWLRSVKVAVIPGFSDAGGCGRPPRFRTLVTGAHNCVFFPHFRPCLARRLCFVVAKCQTNKHDKWKKSFMICLEPSTRREGSLSWNGEDRADSLVRHCDPTLETPTVTYRYFRREGLPIPP